MSTAIITVNVAACGRAYVIDSAWATARNAASGTFSASFLNVFATLTTQYEIDRGFLRFNTSAIIGAVTLAELYLTRSSQNDTPANVHVSLCDFVAGLNGADYAAVKAGYTGNPIGVMSRVSGNLWKRDITAVFAKDATFDLGLAEYNHDMLNVAPAVPYGTQFIVSGAGAPYLQLTTVTDINVPTVPSIPTVPTLRRGRRANL